MFVKRRLDGERAYPVGRTAYSDLALDRTRDLFMLRMASEGMTHREIGRVMNVAPSTVGRRLKGIPPHVQSYYLKRGLLAASGIREVARAAAGKT